MSLKLLDLLKLIIQVAFRNLWLYRLKTIIIATLLGFGAFLAVVGLTLLRDVETSMRESVIGSVAGHLQIYSAKAKDELAIFGGSFMGRADIGVLDDIVPLREAALTVPGVKAFIPMGLDMGLLGRGNELDEGLEALRAALKEGDPSLIRERIEWLTFQIDQQKVELAEKRKLSADSDELNQQADALAKAEDPDFLSGVAKGDEAKLQFLDTKVAPISGEKQPIYLSYLGTDIHVFRENFPKFRVVEGEVLPEGRRGLMLSKKVREDQLKNIVARLFDRLYKRSQRSGLSLESDPENRRLVQDLAKQYGQILAYLDRKEAEQLSLGLDAIGIQSTKADQIHRVSEQLKIFLQVDAKNFLERHRWFYAHIAPLIKLYEISPGETILLRSYTRSGYIKSLPLKVYGIYTFEGLEDSDLAGATNVIDLISFRELFGQMTEASRQELAAMRSQIGVKDIAAEDAEAALFGESSSAELEARSLSGTQRSGVAEVISIKPTLADQFEAGELSRGLALNAAVTLDDYRQLKSVQKKLEEVFAARGLTVKVVDWQAASGIVGQFVNIVRLVLLFALGVIFVVALVIINNSIIVGTLNRIREIGTMRAIGAQKTFVVGMFLAETAITAMLGAMVGTLCALMLLLVLGSIGIPATADVMTFLFSGPRLFPKLHADILFLSPLGVSLIATLASVYAARHAAHIQPAEAMQEKE